MVKIIIEDYNPAWVEMFEEAKAYAWKKGQV